MLIDVTFSRPVKSLEHPKLRYRQTATTIGHHPEPVYANTCVKSICSLFHFNIYAISYTFLLHCLFNSKLYSTVICMQMSVAEFIVMLLSTHISADIV